MKKTSLYLALLGGITALSLGCATPVEYTIRGDGDQQLNQDINGKSLSVVVRIYQLKDAQEFLKLTFDSIASGRPETDFLGPALLQKTDTVIIPGGRYESAEKLLDDTRYVGIVAFFRKPDPFYWRQLATAESIRSNGLSFRVQDCFVQLDSGRAVALPGVTEAYRPDCGSTPMGAYSGDRHGARSSSPLPLRTLSVPTKVPTLTVPKQIVIQR